MPSLRDHGKDHGLAGAARLTPISGAESSGACFASDAKASQGPRRTVAARGMKINPESCVLARPELGPVTGTGAFWENACWAGRFLDDGRLSPG